MKFIHDYSELIENEIAGISFPNEPKNLYDPLSYFLALGGKRMRPLLTILSGELFGEKKENLMPAAIAIELFHNFSLIHDDIMDAAPLRRGKATVHEKWNSNSAILSGDVLLVKAYQLLSHYDAHKLSALFLVFNKTAIEVCEGQQLDMDFENRLEVTEQEYLTMIQLKTAVLLACALQFGAIISNASEENRKNIYDFGLHLGLAFQIQDDILDLYGDPSKVGKQVGGDVICNKKTLLSIVARSRATDTERKELDFLLNEVNIEQKVLKTRSIYDNLNVKAFCEETMKKHNDLAFSAFAKIETPNSKENIKALCNFLFFRDF